MADKKELGLSEQARMNCSKSPFCITANNRPYMSERYAFIFIKNQDIGEKISKISSDKPHVVLSSHWVLLTAHYADEINETDNADELKVEGSSFEF